MEKISVEDLFELLKVTLENGSSVNLENSDIYILDYYIDEFLTDAYAFLHRESLDRLIENSMIDEHIYDKSQQLRGLSLEVESNEELKTVKAIRESKIWNEIMKLSDELLEYIK